MCLGKAAIGVGGDGGGGGVEGKVGGRGGVCGEGGQNIMGGATKTAGSN
jgi:hypothetical protein